MSSKVLITGVAGFLGSHLADALIEKGHQIIGVDNLLGGYEDNVPKEVEFHKLDCNDKSVSEIMKGVDVIYHCAATAYEGLSVFSPYLVNYHNYMSTVNLVNGAVKNNVSRFVFTSSMARYGTNEVPFSEEMNPRPQDPYAISKVASEMHVKLMSEIHGFDYVIGVPHNIIGPRQKYDDPYRNVASIMINLMLQDRQPIIYGDGNQMRCFSFVQDTLQALEKLGFADNVISEVINIGPDEEFITINQLAETISELLDFDLKPRFMTGRPQEVFHANCSANKARNLLGYKTKYSLKQGLTEMIEYIRDRGPKPFNYHLEIELVTEKTPKTWTNQLF